MIDFDNSSVPIPLKVAMQIHNFFSKKKLQYDRVLRATVLLCVW